ncbi:MAG: hypothetical protein A2X13_09750 [Bacteroidetes bacterium GWC2_33_15]|nr:MAG: hypothetical protein A2X10_10625 [Bacteroidetes bacterium GWA2_33_15]OFX48983.1 MAG: hypothetical protein A2X13_09750 [Bacteroidetes bacterium GWC2_33_15]OFX64753.1 MAG: hypothetical protein A2X15_05465 [Bacteroidetes bacterium GWB2_32_14]OFX68455.1 MAG: hypothetical protein A2X14_15020 [Bacteroidetes bacterium GWD2_33_33]HAN19178.1 hypothetical protein [Bacteroidales bacterium]
MVKKILLILLAFDTTCITKGNDLEDNHKPVNLNCQIDIMSQHLWRGYTMSNLPTFEPSFEIRVKDVTSGVWAAQSIDGKYSELDIYLKYSYKNISIGIFDYYCPPTFKQVSGFFDYNQGSTKHTLDFHLYYNGTEKLPFKFLLATMVYGDDINPETNKNYFSTYAEIGYEQYIQNIKVNYILGINPYKSYYGESSGIINTGIKVIGNLSFSGKKSIPVQSSILVNPMNDSVYLAMGFTL